MAHDALLVCACCEERVALSNVADGLPTVGVVRWERLLDAGGGRELRGRVITEAHDGGARAAARSSV